MTASPWIAQAVYDPSDPTGRIKRVVRTVGFVAALQAQPGEAFVILEDHDLDTSKHKISDGQVVAIEPEPEV